MNQSNYLVLSSKTIVQCALGGTTLAGLMLTSRYSYLLFHTLVELFSIVIAGSLFVLAWNTRHYLDDDYLLLLGIASLFVGGMDLLHTLADKGMGLFPGHDADLPMQLSISARYLQSLSLLIAAMRMSMPPGLRKLINASIVLGVYSVITVLLLWAILGRVFPACYIEGSGLTPFKKGSEVVISFILLASILLLWRVRRRFDPSVLRLLLASTAALIGAELAFTIHVHVSDFSNLLGYVFKIVAFYLLYRATVQTGLERPHALLFRNLKQTEEALRLSRERYELAVRGSMDGIWDWDITTNEDYFSERWCEMLGYQQSELRGHLSTWIDLLHPDDRDRVGEQVRRHLEQKDPYQVELRMRTKSGDYRWFRSRGQAVWNDQGQATRMAGALTDISESKRAEEQRLALERQVRQAEKRASLVTMGEAVAHHFNNKLGVVLGNIELAKMVLPPDATGQAELLAAAKATQGAAELSRLMLRYVGRRARPTVSIDLAATIKGLLPLVSSALPGNVRLELDLPPGDHSVMIDPSDAHQMVMSLVTNAWEAIGSEEGSVRISIRTGKKEEISTGVDFAGASTSADTWVCLEVADTGCGMNEETRERMLDPFFTTRFVRQGMGLAVTQSIVRASDGTIFVHSEPLRGTTVRVCFPAGEPVCV
jgi:PAS domain S-box-containing protein